MSDPAPMYVTAHPYGLHFKRPAATSRGALASRLSVFVRVADERRVGWGEAAPVPGLSVDDRPDFVTTVQRVCAEITARGLHPPDSPADARRILGETLEAQAACPSLCFGLETALLDLAGGGRQMLFATPFSRGEALLPIHGLIWMDTPQGILEQIERKVAQGCRVIKMKVGALPWAEELRLLQALRRRWPAGKVELRLDANGAWQPDEAMERLPRLAELEVALLEQPIAAGQWPAMAELCRRSPVPIALDEELIGVPTGQRRTLLETIQPQHLILKPTLLGGLAACEAWIDEARGQDIQWWINSLLEANVGLNAIAQWTAALDGRRVHGLGTGQLFANNVSSPLRLHGCGLRMDGAAAWDFAGIESHGLAEGADRRWESGKG